MSGSQQRAKQGVRNGPGGRGRTNGSEEEMEMTETQEDDDVDSAQRRCIRHQYRELINSVQQNREDLLSPANNKLTEVLEEANKLFLNVNQAREAALDAQFLVLATDLGKEKAHQLQAEGTTFDPSAFAEHLLSYMGLNRLEEDVEDEDAATGGFLPPNAWQTLAKGVQSCFRTAPTFHFMLGSFEAEPPPPRPRLERERKTRREEAKRIMPTQLKKMDQSDQEATEKEVERILSYLNAYHSNDPNLPIYYHEFVTDPNSFSMTVENIFHTSFLIRDGHARMYLDENKLPCIAPVSRENVDESGTSTRHQCVMSINQKHWKEIIEMFEITEALIPSRTSSTTTGSQ